MVYTTFSSIPKTFKCHKLSFEIVGKKYPNYRRELVTYSFCAPRYIARLGDLDLYSEDDGASPVMVPIVAAKVHEDYNPTSHTSDIAILTLQFKPESRKWFSAHTVLFWSYDPETAYRYFKAYFFVRS